MPIEGNVILAATKPLADAIHNLSLPVFWVHDRAKRWQGNKPFLIPSGQTIKLMRAQKLLEESLEEWLPEAALSLEQYFYIAADSHRIPEAVRIHHWMLRIKDSAGRHVMFLRQHQCCETKVLLYACINLMNCFDDLNDLKSLIENFLASDQAPLPK